MSISEYFPGGYILAGTTYRFGDQLGKEIYFASVEHRGFTRQCGVQGGPSGNTERLLNDANYDDERVIANVPLPSGSIPGLAIPIALLIQVHDNVLGYGIKILFVDACLRTVIARDDVYFINGDIFPTDMIYDYNTNQLYVCGYTEGSGTGRSAFVGYTGLSAASGMPMLAYNWSSTLASYYDFDMAVHLKLLVNGNIFVTGSTNANGGSSASMAMIVNSGLVPQYKRVIIDQPLVTDDVHEFSYDVKENSDGSFFLYSNKFKINGQTYPVGYDFETKYPMITYLNADLSGPSSNNRVHIKPQGYRSENWAWGSTIIHDDIIAGLQADWLPGTSCNLNGYNAPSATNVNPFLSKISLSWSGQLNATIDFWKTYHTQNATPTFPSLGGIISNIYWPTKFAVGSLPTKNTVNDIAMTAPILNNLYPNPASAPNNLLYKFMYLDDTGGMYYFGPCDNATECAPETYLKSTRDDGNPQLDLGIPSNRIDGETYAIDMPWVIDTMRCLIPNGPVNSGAYKNVQHKINSTSKSDGVTIYPNPAEAYISIDIPETKGAGKIIRVELINLLGQSVATLFSGSNGDLVTKKLDITNTISGLYFVKVFADNKVIAIEKLNIK